ncbi:putative protein without homology [Propionibacterium freudenreichii subsp. shermanii]|nr:putative protein without homology [Propionibacterium freudenreichii subsp. shermanii]
MVSHNSVVVGACPRTSVVPRTALCVAGRGKPSCTSPGRCEQLS